MYRIRSNPDAIAEKHRTRACPYALSGPHSLEVILSLHPKIAGILQGISFSQDMPADLFLFSADSFLFSADSFLFSADSFLLSAAFDLFSAASDIFSAASDIFSAASDILAPYASPSLRTLLPRFVLKASRVSLACRRNGSDPYSLAYNFTQKGLQSPLPCGY